jgi:hypothetical protein
MPLLTCVPMLVEGDAYEMRISDFRRLLVCFAMGEIAASYRVVVEVIEL